MPKPHRTSPLSGKTILLVGLFSAKVKAPAVLMADLRAAVIAKGAVVAAEVIQRRGVSRAARPGGARRLGAPMSARFYIGTGKANEVAQLRKDTGADAIVINARLTPAQITNLAQLAGCEVMDLRALE